MPPKRVAKCDDAVDPKVCDDGEVCKIATHRCVKDTPANRKGMVSIKHKGNTIIGTPELIAEFKKALTGTSSPPKKAVKGKKKAATPSPPPKPAKKAAKKKRGCIDDGCDDGEICDADTQACAPNTAAVKAGRKVLTLPDGRKLVGDVAVLGPIQKSLGGTLRTAAKAKVATPPKAKTPSPVPVKAKKGKKAGATGVKCVDEPCDADKLCNVSTGRCVGDTAKNKAGKKILQLPDGRRLIGDKAILDPIKASSGGKYVGMSTSPAPTPPAPKKKAAAKKAAKTPYLKCADPAEDECGDGEYCDAETGDCLVRDPAVDLYYTDLPSGRRVSGKEALVQALAMTFGTEVHMQKGKKPKKAAAKKAKSPVAAVKKAKSATVVADDELTSASKKGKKKEKPTSCVAADDYLECGPDEACDASGACVKADASYTTDKHTLVTKDGRTIYGDAVALQRLQSTLGGTMKQPVKAAVVQPTKLDDARRKIYEAFASCVATL